MRYKVFIVEDEIVVRESIRDNVNWDVTDFLLAGEASDGEIALPLIQEIKPDILITDIKMPFMDGLTLSRFVKKSMPWIKIIIISGYDEFTFAKEAISISVTEYLLKPLSSADLLQALNNVAKLIDEESRQRNHIEDLNKCLKNSRQLIAERFLSDLTTGVIPSAEAFEKAKQYGINIVSRFFIAVVFHPQVVESGIQGPEYYEYLKAEKLLHDFFSDTSKVLLFGRNVKENVLIFKGDNAEILEKHCHSVCHSLKYEIERKTSCKLSLYIGGVKERVQGISRSLEEADIAARFNVIFGNHKIVNIDDTKRVNLNTDYISKLDTNEVVKLFQEDDGDAIRDTLDAFFKRIESEHMDVLLRNFMVIDVVLNAIRFIEKLGGKPEEEIPELGSIEQALGAPGSEALQVFLENLIGSVFDFRETCQLNKYGDIIEKAKQYIEESFCDPELTLNKVSAYVNVSSSHFSTIFSQETGKTFIGYLTEIRLRKAKELLKTSSLRSSEIAYEVGYKDPHYFSYLFKTNIGKTPTEYRKG